MEKIRSNSSHIPYSYQNIPPDFVLGGGGGGGGGIHDFINEMGLVDPHIYQQLVNSQHEQIIPVVDNTTPITTTTTTTAATAANLMYAADSSHMLFTGNVVGETSSNVQFGPSPEDVFGFNSPTMSDDPNSNSMINSFSTGFEGDLSGGKDQDQNDQGEHSSALTTTKGNPSSKKAKADRSRTLISERRRRGRMKEKLYALRALVPNITKMDKASIVGDAMLYVQDLQMQAKKLKAEISELESSKCRGAVDVPLMTRSSQRTAGPSLHPAVRKIIMQMDVFQVEERGYYVRVASNKGQGVAVSFYRALESLATNYSVRSSNLNSVGDKFILTFTLHVGECPGDIDMQNLKLWITRALFNQGFEFQSA